MAVPIKKCDEKFQTIIDKLQSKPPQWIESLSSRNIELKPKLKKYSLPFLSQISNNFPSSKISPIICETERYSIEKMTKEKRFLKRVLMPSPNPPHNYNKINSQKLYPLANNRHVVLDSINLVGKINTSSNIVEKNGKNITKLKTKTQSLTNIFKTKESIGTMAIEKDEKTQNDDNQKLKFTKKGYFTDRIQENLQQNQLPGFSTERKKNNTLHIRSQSDTKAVNLDKGFMLYNKLYNGNFSQSKDPSPNQSPPIIRIQVEKNSSMPSIQSKKNFNVSFNLSANSSVSYSTINKDEPMLTRQNSDGSNTIELLSTNYNQDLSGIEKLLQKKKPILKTPVPQEQPKESIEKLKKDLHLNFDDINIMDLSSISSIPNKQTPESIEKIIIKDLPKSPFGRHDSYNEYKDFKTHFLPNTERKLSM
ncbi:unnamed protein product [Blepharisma stoltei]|uniref:Uncharacterized protein n=1 Tax=Blepharisma stoltei TaxID=1481888 RepID=A0AAU9JC21_9CILI|nr:unnamed protein product [Blepharisma stoltei]